MAKRKRSVGRPALGKAARTHVVAVKFSLNEIHSIRRAAMGGGATVSSWIRDHALGLGNTDREDAIRLLAMVVRGGNPTGHEWQRINELIREVSR